MKNIINKIKEKDNICIFILFFLISLGICLDIFIEANDEIWNFQNVYKMYNGFKIYEQINVIITPFFFWLAEITFHIFGANLFIFRLCHCVLISVLSLYTYKILKKLNVPKSLAIFTISILIFQEFFGLIRGCFNYNILALLFCIIGIYFLIEEKTKNNLIIQAIITILVILTKQNIGIYYLLGNIIYIIFSKNALKTKIKEMLKYISIIILGGLIFILYLLMDNNLYNFFSYTFGGILEFANENIIFDVPAIIYMIGIISINIIISIFFIKKEIITQKQKENIKILLIFSVVLAGACYPIFNWMHIMIGTYLTIINIVYMIYLLFEDFKEKIKKIVTIINIIIILAMIGVSSYSMYNWISTVKSDEYPYSWEEPFFGGIISKENYEENLKITQYIQENEKNVIVCSNKAGLYMIPLKRNNGDFDLLFKGNFGFEGENGLIEKIKKMENTQFLISNNEEEDIYQESKKVKEYIKNNKQQVGEIGDFYIYE